MPIRKVFIFLFFIVCYFAGIAQEKTFTILGKVIDSASKQILGGASAFCQNTTYGTITNNEGLFFLRLPNGGYDLVISYTGYEKKIIRLSNTQANTDTIIIELPQQDKTLEEAVVVASNEVPDGWNKYGKFFTDNFIGTTPNAAQCTIQNPEILRFFFNRTKNRLKVSAKEDLVILNNSLGYKIRYQLDSFTYEYNSKLSQYTGYPLFEEMEGSEDEKKQWTKNRTRTYLGSRLHFMHSLYDSVLNEEGFIVEKLDDNAKNIKGTEITDLYDSSIYVADSGNVDINWKGRYRISYKSVLPDKKFLEEFKLPANTRMQVTILDIADGFVIEENGYFYEQYDVINTGYWAWKKLAELVPYDFAYE